MKIKIIILYVFIFSFPIFAVQQVYHIEFKGLKRTKPQLLLRLIKTQIGKPFSKKQLTQDKQKILNLGLFSEVNTKIQETINGIAVIFNLKEWNARIPIFHFGGIKENLWFDLGLKDFNWLGRGYHFGGFYRYYDRHSLALFLRMPHLGRSPWGIAINTSRYATIEPAYFSGETSFYNVDRWEFIFGLIYHISPSISLQLDGGYLLETYRKNIEQSGNNSLGPDYRKFDKRLSRLQFNLNCVNYKNSFVQGLANRLTLEQVVTKGQQNTFWKSLDIFQAYLKLMNHGNIAFRLRAGIATNEDSPFAPFVLDSYITVRGVGNRVARGTAELTFNLEYRHFLLKTNWGLVQIITFLDWSAWRPAGRKLKNMFESQNVVTFGGLGFRLHLRKINNLILRADLGISLYDRTQKGIVLGIGQYF